MSHRLLALILFLSAGTIPAFGQQDIDYSQQDIDYSVKAAERLANLLDRLGPNDVTDPETHSQTEEVQELLIEFRTRLERTSRESLPVSFARSANIESRQGSRTTNQHIRRAVHSTLLYSGIAALTAAGLTVAEAIAFFQWIDPATPFEKLSTAGMTGIGGLVLWGTQTIALTVFTNGILGPTVSAIKQNGRAFRQWLKGMKTKQEVRQAFFDRLAELGFRVDPDFYDLWLRNVNVNPRLAEIHNITEMKELVEHLKQILIKQSDQKWSGRIATELDVQISMLGTLQESDEGLMANRLLHTRIMTFIEQAELHIAELEKKTQDPDLQDMMAACPGSFFL